MQTVTDSFSGEGNFQGQEQSPDETNEGVVQFNFDGKIIFWNQSATRLYGWRSEEVIGRDINEIISNPEAVDLKEKIIQDLRNNQSWAGDLRFKVRDGTTRESDVRAILIQVDQQDFVSLMCWLKKTDEDGSLKVANHLITRIDEIFEAQIETKDKYQGLAEMMVQDLAEWCGIHLVEGGGMLSQVALAPAEIINDQAVYDWWKNDLPDDESDGLTSAIKDKKAIVVSEVNPVRRAAKAGIRSYMIVPVMKSNEAIGTLTLVSTRASRRYDQDSAMLGENLVLHIAAYLKRSLIVDKSNSSAFVVENKTDKQTPDLDEAINQLKQSEDIIQTLFRISNKLNATLDVDLILDELAQEAIRMVNGESGFAGLRTEAGMTVHKYFDHGMAMPFDHTWAIGEGIPGWVLKYKVPYGTSDAANDGLIRHELTINSDVRSIICTPILDTTGEVIAYFDIRNKIGAEGFTINDQEMLLTLAPVASIAIQNALAYQQRLKTVSELKETSRQLQDLAASLESAREEERVRVAQELHDELGQALTALKFDLSWLTERLGQSDEALGQKAKDITAQVNTIIKTVRRIATELRPGMLEDLGLIASIEWQAQDIEKRSGIICQLDLPGEDLSLSKEQSLAIFRIFQEAMTNVVRYSGAKTVQVSLAVTGGLLTLEVIDNGRGIKQEQLSGAHSLGLLGMKERAMHLGGNFAIEGVPNRGTRVKVSIPLTRKLS